MLKLRTIKLGAIVFLVSLVFSLSLVYAYQYYFATSTHQIQAGLVLLGATITVPDNYPTIQEAINVASDGDTIFVRNGTYVENIVVNKSISLIGEDQEITLINSGGTVIWIHESDNVNICNFTIQGGSRGIDCSKSSGLRISNNIITGCNGRGIVTSDVSGRILNNTLTENWIGFLIKNSHNLILEDNQILNNSFNFGIINCQLSSLTNISIDYSNTVNGKPIHWLLNQHNIVVNASTFPDIGYLAFINSTGILIDNITLTCNYQGILLAYSSNCTIQETTIDYNYLGVELFQSNLNDLTHNYIAHGWLGVELKGAHNNTIIDNTVRENVDMGIGLSYSHNNTLTYNIILDDQDGIIMSRSTGNIVTTNTITQNGCGLLSDVSEGNNIYHNNFLANSRHLFLYVSNNTWDNSCEGNYWSNYNGTDLDEDGIGDEYLPWEGVDNYPLMNPYWNLSDINHDLEVDIFDVVAACAAYSSNPIDSNWNCHCDITEPYGIINIFDIVIICSSYGEEYTP